MKIDNKPARASRGWTTLGIWVVAAFALLIGAWTALVYVASRNAPEPVPIIESP